jgi:carboxypeptidase Taq
VAARRERAALVGPALPAYDVLADDYSAGLTAARLTEVFDAVKAGLTPFLAELRARGAAPEAAWLKGEYDVDKQAALCRELAVDLGFDLTKGRLDVSVHPFTGERGATRRLAVHPAPGAGRLLRLESAFFCFVLFFACVRA